MRVYQINTLARTGGAAIAAVRLHQGLMQAGVESRFISPDIIGGQEIEGIMPVRFGGSAKEIIWRRWRRSQLGRLRRRHQITENFSFTPDLSGDGMALLEMCQGADVLNFHWMAHLLDYPFVLPRLNPEVPLVWTLHDMSPATGGCYYAMDCQAFRTKCGKCPVLGSTGERDLSTLIWERKLGALKQLRAHLSLVTPSEWLAREVRQSSLLGQFSVKCIPNGVDTEVFRPRDRQKEKQKLGIKPDKPVILFVAAALDSERKGGRHLVDALPLILKKHPEVQFLAVGDIKAQDDWPVSIHVISAKEEETMAQIYASADLLLVPSVSDNLPNVILEALACGVPVVGFSVGGIPEAIGLDGETGWVAPEKNSAALAEAVCHLLPLVIGNRQNWEQRCRARAMRDFSLKIQADRYMSLYHSLLETGAVAN